jgi:hypothetical protein
MSEPERPVVRNQQQPPKKRKKNTLPPNKAPVAYEYKLVPYIQQNVEELFNIYGETGWRYVANESGTGKAVFVREKRS